MYHFFCYCLAKGFIKEGWINIGKNLEVVIHDI